MTRSEPIPRRILFGNPTRAALEISPDGRSLAWLAPDAGVLNVWVAPVSDPDGARVVTGDRLRGIRRFAWLPSSDGLIYLQDQGGDENWHIYRVDLSDADVRDLTPFGAVHAKLVRAEPSRPGEIVVALNDRDPAYHDVYTLDVATGDRTLLVRNERFGDIVVDADYVPRLAVEPTPQGGFTLHRASEDGGFTPWLDVDADDAATTDIVEVEAGGTRVWMRDSRGRDTAALLELDLADDSVRRVLADDPRCDASDVLMHPVTHRPQAVTFRYETARWTILDPDVQDVFDLLAASGPGEIRHLARSHDDRLWTAERVVDDGPSRLLVLDRAAGEVRDLFATRPELEGVDLAPMHPVVIRSRDGLDMVSYLTLPLGSDADGDGVPDAPVPLVLVPHGGPWSRDVWGFSALHQWLADRGYGVLSPNFRSSTGFGKAFTNAGDRAWATGILDDQQDAVRWAIDRGVADPDRVAVLGGSFGGYSVLAGLAFHPGTFACGVDIVGPSNLVTLLNSIPAYWTSRMAEMRRRVGDPDSAEGRALLEAHSPLNAVDRIDAPLLIAQGANDPRVKQAESDQIVAAMKQRGIPVSYVLFPDEGHGFARPQNNVAFFALAEAFLAQVLGGRFEPLGDDLEGTSAVVLEGRSGVPGLPDDALTTPDDEPGVQVPSATLRSRAT